MGKKTKNKKKKGILEGVKAHPAHPFTHTHSLLTYLFPLFLTFSPLPPLLGLPTFEFKFCSTKSLGKSSKTDRGRQEEHGEVYFHGGFALLPLLLLP